MRRVALRCGAARHFRRNIPQYAARRRDGTHRMQCERTFIHARVCVFSRTCFPLRGLSVRCVSYRFRCRQSRPHSVTLRSAWVVAAAAVIQAAGTYSCACKPTANATDQVLLFAGPSLSTHSPNRTYSIQRSLLLSQTGRVRTDPVLLFLEYIASETLRDQRYWFLDP